MSDSNVIMGDSTAPCSDRRRPWIWMKQMWICFPRKYLVKGETELQTTIDFEDTIQRNKIDLYLTGFKIEDHFLTSYQVWKNVGPRVFLVGDVTGNRILDNFFVSDVISKHDNFIWRFFLLRCRLTPVWEADVEEGIVLRIVGAANPCCGWLRTEENKQEND